MNKKKVVYLILLIVTALTHFLLPEITGHNHILVRSFGIIPFIFLVLFLFASDTKNPRD